jgi:hypothetical protein
MSKPLFTKEQSLDVARDIQAASGTGKPLQDPVAALTALAALYQGEKTDASSIFYTAMALMGVAVAYLVGAVPFIGTLQHVSFGWIFVLLLPMPLWLVIAFHSLITLNAMSHGISVKIIEDELFDASELQVERELVGSAAGDKIMDITQAKPIHRLTTRFVYFGVGLLVLLFTGYAVYSANEVMKHSAVLVPTAVICLASVVYVLLLVLVARSWRKGLLIIDQGRRKIANHVKRFGLSRTDPPKLNTPDSE